MKSLVFAALAIAAAHAVPYFDTSNRDAEICWNGIHGECAPVLADYSVAQEYCSASYPVACSVGTPKAKRSAPIAKACKNPDLGLKSPPSAAQVSAWSRVQAQEPDVVSTICACIETPKACPSHVKPGKPKPGLSKSALTLAWSKSAPSKSSSKAGWQKPGPSKSASRADKTRPWSTHAFPSPAASHSYAPHVRSSAIPSLRYGNHTASWSSSSSITSSAFVSESSSPSSLSSSSQPSSSSSLSSSSQSSSTSGPSSSSVSSFSSESSFSSTSSTTSDSSSSSTSSSSSVMSTSSSASYSSSSSSTITSFSDITSSTTSSASSSSSSVVPLPCDFQDSQLQCSDNGQQFGAVCGGKVTQANEPDGHFLYTTNPPEYIDCLNECAGNDFCYVWSYTRDAGGNTCYLYQNVNGDGSYDTAYDPYSVRGYYVGPC